MMEMFPVLREQEAGAGFSQVKQKYNDKTIIIDISLCQRQQFASKTFTALIEKDKEEKELLCKSLLITVEMFSVYCLSRISSHLHHG